MQLQGFNNLTKSLAVSLYKIAYIESPTAKQNYINQINKHYSAKSLATDLNKYASAIGGSVLNSAIHNYQPQGASVTLMIAEEECSAIPTSIVNHLDKSHLCIHTYPEEHFRNNIAIFRADIEISTCGVITPLKLLNNIFDNFLPDLVNIDYRVRGFSCNEQGEKQFTDHEIESIQQYLNQNILQAYQIQDINLAKANLFHSSMLIKELNLKSVFSEEMKIGNLTKITALNDQLMVQLREIFSSLTS